jgi:hypothetical protein
LNKKMWFLVLTGLIAVGIYYVFWEYPEQLRKNIYNEDGYEINRVTNKFPVKFAFQSDWTGLEKGETKNIQQVLLKNMIRLLF